MIYVGIALLWLTIGWLPTRLMKHHFLDEFGDWSKDEELFSLGFAALGPLGVMGTLLAWFDMTLGRPKGWKW